MAKPILAMEKIDTACIIADDSIATFGLQRSMKQVDFCSKVIVLNDGLEAIINLQVRKKLPTIIFFDLNMPIMDGWAFLDEFKKIAGPLFQKVHLFLMTSSIYRSDYKKVEDLGMSQLFDQNRNLRSFGGYS